MWPVAWALAWAGGEPLLERLDAGARLHQPPRAASGRISRRSGEPPRSLSCSAMSELVIIPHDGVSVEHRHMMDVMARPSPGAAWEGGALETDGPEPA